MQTTEIRTTRYSYVFSAYRHAEQQRRQAREQLRDRIRTARDERISYAAIARAARLSLERVRQLYAGR